MSSANLERLRALLPPEGADFADIWGPDGTGLPGIGDLVAPDAKVRWVARDAETEEVGADGFRSGWEDWLEPWESYRIYYEDLLDRGDRIVLLVVLRGVTKRDGVEMEHEAAAVFRFEGEQVVEMEFMLDREAALNVRRSRTGR